MKIKLWGTRGSIASAGPETVRYGGDTSSIELRTVNNRVVVLDAGSGVRRLGGELAGVERVDILLSHLHMDHVQGLPFFRPLLDPDVEVNIWGPMSSTRSLEARLARYLSPPLFPIRVKDLPNVGFHDVPLTSFEIDTLKITADVITHPGTTLGFRIEEGESSLAYMPDHEPALGCDMFPNEPLWTSGFSLAKGVDVLIHDSQYTDEEYSTRVGWGHTSFSQLEKFVSITGAAELVTFHHDPAHTDTFLDEVHQSLGNNGFKVSPGVFGLQIEV
ncbi:MAG TPA: MBL fold metallo-hydrolase [Acidimicrobiia bacterium]|nr:MBL fold metallo-hydrolase [Acidimicrobiia bacterium]